MRYLLAAMLLACSGCAAPQATTDILGSGTIERVDPETGRVTLEKLPILIGGLQELQKSIRYPETAKQERRQGVVRLQVIVDEAGAPEEITVLQSAGADLDRAAIMAMVKARFIPGEQNGIPVKVKMSIPITFKLRTSTQRTGRLGRSGRG